MRQLQNFCERLALTYEDDRTYDGFSFVDCLGSGAQFVPGKAPRSGAPLIRRDELGTLAEAVARCERDYLERLLRAHEGRRVEAARAAGISRRTLLRKLKKLGMERWGLSPAPGGL